MNNKECYKTKRELMFYAICEAIEWLEKVENNLTQQASQKLDTATLTEIASKFKVARTLPQDDKLREEITELFIPYYQTTSHKDNFSTYMPMVKNTIQNAQNIIRKHGSRNHGCKPTSAVTKILLFTPFGKNFWTPYDSLTCNALQNSYKKNDLDFFYKTLDVLGFVRKAEKITEYLSEAGLSVKGNRVLDKYIMFWGNLGYLRNKINNLKYKIYNNRYDIINVSNIITNDKYCNLFDNIIYI